MLNLLAASYKGVIYVVIFDLKIFSTLSTSAEIYALLNVQTLNYYYHSCFYEKVENLEGCLHIDLAVLLWSLIDSSRQYE